MTSPSQGYSSVPIEDLVRDCASGTPAAWEEFLRRSHPVIASTIFRTACRYRETSSTLVDELIQDTYLRLCENQCRVLREFRSEHPDAFFGLLKTVAFCVANDHFRAALAAKRGSGKVDSLETVSSPSATGFDPLPALERDILLEEIDAFLKVDDIQPVERQIFWLYYRHGVTAKAIAALPTVELSAKGVESLLLRLTQRLRTLLVGKRRSKEVEKSKGKSAGGSL